MGKLLLCVVLFGCACQSSVAPRPEAPRLRQLDPVVEAHFYRDRGTRLLERAYAARRTFWREAHFRSAMTAFERAQVNYHDALALAEVRYRPVLETEIAQVAEYMWLIQRDRQPLSWWPAKDIQDYR